MIYYPNCSELVADFEIRNPKKMLSLLTRMAKKYDWIFEPRLSLDLLQKMKEAGDEIRKHHPDDDSRFVITVLDSHGKSTSLEYGPNGYDDELAFRFDTGCSHYDENQYHFLLAALETCNAQIKSYDGGSTDPFEKWMSKQI